MSKRIVDPNEIEWDRMSALIVRRINVMRKAWRYCKTEFDETDYRIAYFNVFYPLLVTLLTFLEQFEKRIEDKNMDRMH
ncbi:MAG TPA: hypothetical protein VFA57_00355 [Pseudolabrys sp.]|nr:hypothetical protein [Pseudolabrys sp.]